MLNTGKAELKTKPYDKKQAAREALLAYMLWYSEKMFCAGWFVNLPDDMASNDIRPFKFLVDEAGGWYIYDKLFIPGPYQRLLDKGSGENCEK